MPNLYSWTRSWPGAGDLRKVDKRGGKWLGNLLPFYRKRRGGYWQLMASTSPADEKEMRTDTWKWTHQRPRPTMCNLLQRQPSRFPPSHSNPLKFQLSQLPKQLPQTPSPGSYPLQTPHSPVRPDSHPPRIIKSIHLRLPESFPDHHSPHPCPEARMQSGALVHPV
jgi:hypothetical protein